MSNLKSLLSHDLLKSSLHVERVLCTEPYSANLAAALGATHAGLRAENTANEEKAMSVLKAPSEHLACLPERVAARLAEPFRFASL